MNLLQALSEKKNFTETERIITDYILAHKENIPTTYIQDLSKQTFCSHSAVIRLCKKLGFNGYRDFKIALIKEIEFLLHHSSKVDANLPFEDDDSPEILAKKIADLSTRTIKNTFRMLNYKNLNGATKLIAEADRIFLFAVGDSQIRARSFQNKFNKINKYLIIANEYGEEDWAMVNIKVSDVVIFISYSGITPQEKLLHYFKKNKIPSISITGNPHSQLALKSTISLLVPQEEYDFFKVATFASQVSIEYVLDLLFSLLYQKSYTKFLGKLHKNQQFLSSKKIEK
ncbi:MAG: MurR/RpiR family transcriptional regulator [Lactovum sp.]